MTQSPSPNDRLIAEARRAIEQDRPADARPLLERAVRQDAGDPRPWLVLGGIAPPPVPYTHLAPPKSDHG